MSTQILVLAKAPVPGRVKTRLCPPCTPRQAATIAQAAIDDTLDAVDATDADWRTIVADGELPARPGWRIAAQCTGDLDARLAHAFAATARPDTASLLIGMDTPQVTARMLNQALAALARSDAALGLASDGGWWALALRDPRNATALHGITTSQPDTGLRTLAALRALDLRVATLPGLCDVDTARDAVTVAAAFPRGRFAAAVRAAGLGLAIPAEAAR